MGKFVEAASFTVPLKGGPLVPDDDEKNHLVAMLTAAGTEFTERWGAIKCVLDACYMKGLFIDPTEQITSETYPGKILFQVQYIVPSNMVYPRNFRYALWLYIDEVKHDKGRFYVVRVVDKL